LAKEKGKRKKDYFFLNLKTFLVAILGLWLLQRTREPVLRPKCFKVK